MTSLQLLHFIILSSVIIMIRTFALSWTIGLTQGSGYPSVDLGETQFSQLFALSGVIKRECDECVSDRQIVYYRRITNDVNNAYANMKAWSSTNNILNTNFILTNDENSAISDYNPSNAEYWQFCNYDDSSVGAFRDCRPNSVSTGGWQMYCTRSSSCKSVRFSILTGPKSVIDNIISPFPTRSPTKYPTLHPTAPTSNPTPSPTSNPTPSPTPAPTYNPTFSPTMPTNIPTFDPTSPPTIYPTYNPTNDPTYIPTSIPTVYPTNNPTSIPTMYPTDNPTWMPTKYPTFEPTMYPTDEPTLPTHYPTKAIDVEITDVYTTLNKEENIIYMETKNDNNIFVIVLVFSCIVLGLCAIIIGLIIWVKKSKGKTTSSADLEMKPPYSHSENIGTQIERVTSVSSMTSGQSFNEIIKRDVSLSPLPPKIPPIVVTDYGNVNTKGMNEGNEGYNANMDVENDIVKTIHKTNVGKQYETPFQPVNSDDEIVNENHKNIVDKQYETPFQPVNSDDEIVHQINRINPGHQHVTPAGTTNDNTDNDAQPPLWFAYVNQYGKKPQNAFQLLAFSKTNLHYKSLTFKEATMIYNQMK